MRGLSRRKAALARRKQLKELPKDDGLVPVLMIRDRQQTLWGLVPAEAVHDAMAEKMAKHDRRDGYERWGGNQWGEQWVERPELRTRFAFRMPLLKTDLGYKAWCRAQS